MNGQARGDDLRQPTKALALRVIRLYGSLSRSGAAGVIGRQLVRSGTSVGAQYREACRARSRAEFISKVESASQELDETQYWLELLSEASLVPQAKLAGLVEECDELMAILTASVRTAKAAGKAAKR